MLNKTHEEHVGLSFCFCWKLYKFLTIQFWSHPVFLWILSFATHFSSVILDPRSKHNSENIDKIICLSCTWKFTNYIKHLTFFIFWGLGKTVSWHSFFVCFWHTCMKQHCRNCHLFWFCHFWDCRSGKITLSARPHFGAVSSPSYCI